MTGKKQDHRLDRLETIWRATPVQDAVWERLLAEVGAAEGIVPDALRSEAERILAERPPGETARQFASRLATARGADGVVVDQILAEAERLVAA